MLEVIGQQVYMLRPFFSRGFSGTRVVERDFRTKTFTLLWDVNQTCVEPIQLAKNLYSIFIVLRSHLACVADALNLLYIGFRRVRGPAATQASSHYDISMF